jgi:hypothetical protein
MDTKGGRTVVSGLPGTRTQMGSHGGKMADVQCRATEKSMVSCHGASSARSSWGCSNVDEWIRARAEGFTNSTTRA